MTESQYGFFGFVDNNENEMTVYSWSKTVMNDCAVNIKPLIFPIEDSGIWGNAIRERRPVIYNDYGMALMNKKGFPEGHVVIKKILSAPVFSSSGKITAFDIPARYGGEEFVVLFPEISASNAAIVAERLRKEIENTTVEAGDEQVSVTASFGISDYFGKSSSKAIDVILSEFISSADQALYTSKNTGRNRVTIFAP